VKKFDIKRLYCSLSVPHFLVISQKIQESQKNLTSRCILCESPNSSTNAFVPFPPFSLPLTSSCSLLFQAPFSQRSISSPSLSQISKNLYSLGDWALTHTVVGLVSSVDTLVVLPGSLLDFLGSPLEEAGAGLLLADDLSTGSRLN